MNIKTVILTFSVLVLVAPHSAQAISTKREVVCYYFKGSELKRRDVCKFQDFDTSSRIIWSDGVKTQIRWVSRYSNTPSLDGVPAREYERDSETLEVIERPVLNNSVRCLQALESDNSVCWSR